MGVRIPRITLKADFGDDSAFGDLSLLSVGYGLHQAWVFATMFGTSSVFGATRLFEGLYGSSVSLSYLVSICVYVFCLLFMGLTNQRFLRLYISRAFLTTGALLSFAGTALLLAPFLPDFPALELISGVMTGIGSSVLIIYWGTAYARCDSASIVFNTAIAVFVSFGLFATVLHYAPQPIAAGATAVIPLLELVILWKKTPESFYKRDDVPLFKPLPINQGKFLLRFATPVFVLGIALGMLRSQSLQTVVSNQDIVAQPLLLLAAGLATVLILITIMAINGGDRLSRFFQPLIPFIAVTVFFIPLAGDDGNLLANTFLIVGFLCFESLMWIFFSDLSQRFRLSPVFVFGIGRGTMAAAVLIGSLAPIAAASTVHEMAFGEQTIIVAMLLIMVVAYAMLPREQEIETIIMPCPLVKAVSASFEHEQEAAKAASARGCGTAPEMEGLVARAAAYPAEKLAEGAVCDDFEGDALEQLAGEREVPAPAGAADETGAGPEDAAETVAETASEGDSAVPAPADASGPNPAPAQAAATASAPEKRSPGPSEARRAIERTSGEGAQDPNERVRGGGRFRGKCETVANTYLLSRRETEILFFLAKGHNAAYIQEKLFISEGTAKTHIRHIYRKLDVHNQQDLMRIVEDAPHPED